MLAAAWLGTTGLAWFAILRGEVALHRELMVRSYVVTFSFVFFRLIEGLPVLTGMAPPDRYATIGWLCWTVPLLATELLLQARRIAGGPAKGHPAAADQVRPLDPQKLSSMPAMNAFTPADLS